MKYLVHIGYAKCGSSFLQSTLFNGSHPEIGVLDTPQRAGAAAGYRKSGGKLFIDTEVEHGAGHVGYTPFAFDFDAGRERLGQYVTQDKPWTVLSNEDWAGHPISGGTHAGTVATRIKGLLPEAKILIVIREQRAMLLSAYAHFLTMFSGRVRLKSYLMPSSSAHIPTYSPHFYQFSHLISHYRESFGAENVKVLPLEQMVGNPSETLGEICDFISVSEPVEVPVARQNRRDYRHYALLRDATFLNAMGRRHVANGYSSGRLGNLSKQIGWLGRLYPDWRVKQVLARDRKIIEAHLAPYIRRDNQVLSEMLELDLGALGYLT
ncbi:MAG: sulfotransferase [Pseudomonadota bacterium]